MKSQSTSRHLRRLAGATLFGAASLGAACGHFHRGEESPPDAILVFINQSLSQADVFLVAPGTESRRIGTVMGGRTDTLVVPRDFASRATTLNIVARLFASSARPQSGPISISPGDYFEVTLPNDEKVLTVLPGRP